MNSPEPVCAVIVTYNPDESFEGRFMAISGQVHTVFVIDNGSGAEAREMLGRLVRSTRHQLRLNPENEGIATALNHGARAALAAGYTWAVLLDQDSLVEPDTVAELLRVSNDPDCKKPIAIVGSNTKSLTANGHFPRWLRAHRHLPLLFQRVLASEIDCHGVTQVITSGSLVNLQTCSQLGWFWDDLFIDYVDFEYCVRAIRSGYRVMVAPRAVISHQLGRRRPHKFGVWTMHPLFHDASRVYYIWRNRLTVMRRHGMAIPHWSLYELMSGGYWALRILLLEDRRREKLLAMLTGTIDGFRGKLGPIGTGRTKRVERQ